MANTLSPTAANIISSLGIKGSTVNEALPGYVPVLGPDGKLSADFIPANAAQASLPHLSDAAFIDPHTEVDEGLRNGSIVAPYKTIGEAAIKFTPSEYSVSEGLAAFILAPGTYNDSENDNIDFSSRPDIWSPKKLYLIGIGACRLLNPLAVSGMYSGSQCNVVIQNIDAGSNSITITGSPVITCLGRTYTDGSLIVGAGATLRLSADAYVASTDAGTIEYISKDASIGNTSAVRGSATVKNALDRLDSRKIRISRISGSGSGITVGSSYDMSAESAGGFDIYDIGGRDRSIVNAIKELYGKFSNINAQTVTAVDIDATGTLTAKTLSIDVLKLGGCEVEIDNYGYLVVSSPPPAVPDDGAVILRDMAPGDGRLWLVGVYDGRMFVERFYEDDLGGSDSSSYLYPYEVEDAIDLLDGTTRYKVEIVGGQMQIETVNA